VANPLHRRVKNVIILGAARTTRNVKVPLRACIALFLFLFLFIVTTTLLNPKKEFFLELTLRVEFFLKNDSRYQKDTSVNLFTKPLGIPSAISLGQLYQSTPLPIPGDLGRGPSHESPVLEHDDTYGQSHDDDGCFCYYK